MKQRWEKLAARIDALSLRERVFLFLSILVSCGALVDALWLSPAKLLHKQLNQRFEKQNKELQLARDELRTVGKPVEVAIVQDQERVAVKMRLDQVNQAIKTALPMASEGAPLVQVLQQLLRRHDGLSLVRTATLTSDVAANPALLAGASTPASALAAPLTRQGLELTVSGAYVELTRYVQTLEAALPHVRWGVMHLKSEKQPPELTLQLYVLGVPS